MPEIQAFRGVRYDLGHVGSLADVVAPPYDVISPDEQTRLYERHPANVVRLILNRAEPADDEESNGYTRAAKFLRDWRRQGVLFEESDPALYVYHQQFDYEGQSYTRRGFMARVRLSPFGEGDIFPHEETMSGPKEDRRRLMTACRANLSPVFGLYPDPQAAAQQRLEAAIAGQTPLEATDDLGVVHRLWPVTDVATIAAIAGELGAKPVFIADGHHRYETSCTVRDEIAREAGGLDAAHPANFTLMTLVGMSDPGMVVFPTHRLFRGLPEMNSGQLIERLGDCFAARLAGEGSDLAENVWQELATGDDAAALGLYTSADERWVIAHLTETGRRRMDEVASDHSQQWRRLGVSVLHRLLMETLLEARDLPKPEYVHRVDEVVAALDRETFPLAALVLPPTLEEIRQISQRVERMPAKSTYFYPKLLSGLVINPLA